MSTLNGCPHLFAVWVSQLESHGEKQEFQRFQSDGTPALYLWLLVKGLNEMSL